MDYNNPGNIRLIKMSNGSLPPAFVGEIRPNSGSFRKFDTIQNGYRAMFTLLKNSYLKNGYNTINKIIPRYAPSSDNNNPEHYINFIEDSTGIDRDTTLKTYEDLSPIIYAMSKMETGLTPNKNFISQALQSIYNPANNITYFKPEGENFFSKHKTILLIGAGLITATYLTKKR